MHKRFVGWFRKPFFRRGADSDRLVEFSALGKHIGKRPSLAFAIVFLSVLIVEVPLRAQAFARGDYRLIWLAATLVGLLFFFAFKFFSNRSENYLSKLYFGLTAKDFEVGLAGGLIAFAWAFSLNALFSQRFPILYANFLGNGFLFQQSNLVLAIASSAILRPLGEELLFRDYFLEIYRENHGPWIAIIVVSLLFGLRSVDPFLFVINFGIGLLFGWAAHKFQTRAAIISSMVYSLLLIFFITTFGI